MAPRLQRDAEHAGHLLQPSGNGATAGAFASTGGGQRHRRLTTETGGRTSSAEPQGRRVIRSSHQAYQALQLVTLFRASLNYQTSFNTGRSGNEATARASASARRGQRRHGVNKKNRGAAPRVRSLRDDVSSERFTKLIAKLCGVARRLERAGFFSFKTVTDRSAALHR